VKKIMRVGILETGHPPAELECVPSYPAMIIAALGSRYAYAVFDVRSGELPGEVADIDAYIITGSQSGVHDADAWIASLRNWVRKLERTTPLVGICFGHQLMAEAYGGAVEISNRGWAHGLHEYRICARRPWMDTDDAFVLPVSHRDQVTTVPRGSHVIATSEFCPNAAISYDDRCALSFQGHPEFSPEYAAMLVDLRQRKGTIGLEQAERARASFHGQDDCVRVREWIHRFLEDSCERPS